MKITYFTSSRKESNPILPLTPHPPSKQIERRSPTHDLREQMFFMYTPYFYLQKEISMHL